MSFHFQAPLCFVAILLVYCILKMPAKDQRNWEDKLKNVDFVGAFTLIVAVLGIIYALDRGSNLAWRDPITLTSFAIGILVFALFIFVELRIAAEPFAPGRIIFERSLFASYLCNLFSFAGWMVRIDRIACFLLISISDILHIGSTRQHSSTLRCISKL